MRPGSPWAGPARSASTANQSDGGTRTLASGVKITRYGQNTQPASAHNAATRTLASGAKITRYTWAKPQAATAAPAPTTRRAGRCVITSYM